MVKSLILLFAIAIISTTQAMADDSHYVLDVEYGSGQAIYRTMPDAYIPAITNLAVNQAKDVSATLYDREDGNFLIGGGLNYMTNRFLENGTTGTTDAYINTNFLALMLQWKWFPFSQGQRWFYLQWGIGFAGSLGDGTLDDGTHYKIKGFGAAGNAEAGLAIPVSKSIELHVGLQVQGVGVTDFIVPYSGIGSPLLSFGVMF
jgi:hypothetical protein